jgi:lipopolysaccharide/colanic/teichoic acid biosynthesis glycosyltransferase
MVFDRRETTILLVGDFCILAGSLWVALLLRNLSFPALSYFRTNIIPFLPMFFLSLAIFYVAGLYEKQTRPIRRVMGARIFGAQVATVAIAAILFFALPLSIEPKTILVLYLFVSVAAESVWRSYRMAREVREGRRVPAVLVGSGGAVREMYDEVQGNDRYLIRFVRHQESAGSSEREVEEALAAGVDAGARIVVVDTFDPVIARVTARLGPLTARGVLIQDFASLYEEIFDRIPLDHLDSAQLLESVSGRRTVYDGAKRVFDITLALIGIVIAAPIVALAALMLSLESGAPFFLHERVGAGGRTFRMLKMRSMLLNDHGDPLLQKKNRVTRLGRFLRKMRIDELPQLWNVLVGDLSFIGPRPELPRIAEVYEKEIPQYWVRHLIPPGLSGWAQIHDYDAPRGGADVLRTRRKLSLDLYYLKHRSFGLDLAIAMKTLRTLLAFSGT